MNLIPKAERRSLGYWCTWATQNNSLSVQKGQDSSTLEGAEGALLARDNLNEKTLFGAQGWANQFFPKVRQQLYLMLDDGWDVGYGIDARIQRQLFGTLEVNQERFPSCQGEPAERLRKLNEMAKRAGWRGLGIWVACQTSGTGNAPDYWRQRAKWSADAGIEYWKVDWGLQAHNLSYRKMMTEIAKAKAPGLILEHAYCMGPINDCFQSGRFAAWKEYFLKYLELLSFSDVVRSYDVTTQLSVASTLDRIAAISTNAIVPSSSLGLLNCEDEVYIGAVLNHCLGVMRSPLWLERPDMNYDLGRYGRRLAEVTRAVQWQAVAPPVSLRDTVTKVSDKLLTDTWLFRKGETWDKTLLDREVSQTAPAVIVRGNMDLPKVVAAGDVPFVVASTHPNGSLAIATLPRTSIDKGLYMPLARVRLEAKAHVHTVGILGEYTALELVFPDSIEGKRILAQDLCLDEAVDITNKIKLQDNALVIPGDILKSIGSAGQSEQDLSYPGLLIQIE